VVDLPGFGLSSEPGWVLDAADHLTDLILAFLRQRILAEDSQAG
jgi:hypothetical protein